MRRASHHCIILILCLMFILCLALQFKVAIQEGVGTQQIKSLARNFEIHQVHFELLDTKIIQINAEIQSWRNLKHLKQRIWARLPTHVHIVLSHDNMCFGLRVIA
jgi:hypothetical protein